MDTERASSGGCSDETPLPSVEPRLAYWPKHSLTPVEQRILELLGAGMTRSEVAGVLGVSTETVSHSLTTAKEKVGARTPTEAVVRFLLGVVTWQGGFRKSMQALHCSVGDQGAQSTK